MSKNPKATTPETEVLKTGAAGMILRWTLISLGIGALIGICVMLVLNLGLFDKPAASEPQEVVAHLASNEAEAQSDLDSSVSATKINLSSLGIRFYFKPVTYDGNVHTLVATNNDGSPVTDAQLDALGLAVTYYNNVHTDAGTYDVFAVFTDNNSEDGVEYEPLSVKASMVINRANIKGITLNDKLVEYKKGTVHTVEVVGDIPEGTYVEYSMNRAEEIGVYNVVAIIHGANYNPLTLNATLTIVRLQDLVSFDEESYTFTYDGKSHSVKLNTEEVLPEIIDDRNFKVSYSGNGVVNAGDYTVTATVSAEGFTTFSVSVPVKVEKGDLVKVLGIEVLGGTFEYDKKAHEATVKRAPSGLTYTVEYTLDGEAVEKPVKPGTYKVKFTFPESDNFLEKVLECEITINKVDISSLFTFKNGSFKYAVNGENDTPYERSIELFYDEIALSDHGIDLSGLKITYVYGDQKSDEPFKFTEVGEYVIKVIVTGDDTYTEYYADVELEATLTIKYATLTGVSVDTSQMVIANGKYQVPEYDAPAGTDVKCYLGDKEVDGVKNFGMYRVKMVFTKGNYQTTKTVTMVVMFDPKIVAICAAIGILAGLGLGITFVVRAKRRDEESDAKFARPTEILSKARGNIICQSYAKYGSPAVDGRLYLTDKTVEFYNQELTQSNRILIPLRSIRNVDVVNPDTIRIRANDQDHVFAVPACQAPAWKDKIVYAKAAPVVKRPDSVVVIEKQTEAQPASETLTTVDFQVKVKTEPGASPEVTSEVTGTETTVTGAAPAADSPKE